MKVQGEGFKFFVDGESKTVEETKSLIHNNMTITIKGLDVFYFSPKKETKKKEKLELEDLRTYLLNDNSTPKDATDILYLITAENEEELCQRFSETKLKNYAKEEVKSCKNPHLELIEDLEAKTEKRIRLANKLKEACIKRFDLENPILKTEKLLKEAEEHQKQNGGVLQGMEFPFDSTKQNHFVNVPFGNNGTGGVKVFFNKEIENAKKETEDTKIKPHVFQSGLLRSDTFHSKVPYENVECQKQKVITLKEGNFPFDSSSIASKEIYNQILDISHSLEKQFIDFNFRLPKENVLGDGFFNKLKETEGQKHNEGKLPIDTMLTVQFPKAIQAVCNASLFGHEKYKETDKDWLNYKRVKGGSTTYANAGQRHNFNKAGKDEQSGLPHIVHKCWNALAELELWIEENKYE